MGGPPGYKGGQPNGKGIIHKSRWQQQQFDDWRQTGPYQQPAPQPSKRIRPALGQHTPTSAYEQRPVRPSVRPTSTSSYRIDTHVDEDEEEEVQEDWDAYRKPENCEDYEEDPQLDVNDSDGFASNCYADNDDGENLNQASASVDGFPSAGQYIGTLKMLNEKKGFGFISPVLSELPPEYLAASSGVWFFEDHHLSIQQTGMNVQFNMKIAGNGKPQAVDVVLADPDVVEAVGAQDFQRTVHDAIIHGMKDVEAHQCHNGHSLKEFVTEQNGYGCNTCGNEFPANTTMFACRECNVDKCGACYYQRASASNNAGDNWEQAARSAQPKASAVKTPSQKISAKKAYDAWSNFRDNFNKVLVVSTLPVAWSIMDVEQHFVRFGPVDNVFMLPDHDRTCGIVFSTKQAALKASERTKVLIHGSGQGMMGCLTIQHFSALPPDMKRVIEEWVEEFAPSLKEDPKPPPPKFAMRERLIGTISSTVVSGMRIISSSKLPSGTAAFDPALAPEDALEGATVAFGIDDKDKRNIEGYAMATILEVLSRPSPENASLLAKAATVAAPRNAVTPESSQKKSTKERGKDVNLKCFPCKNAAKLGRCNDEANCPYAHTLAEIQPLPDIEIVTKVAKKRFGKASLSPMAAPSMLPMSGPRPMGFGMMPPVMGVNPFMPSMGMPHMGFGMNPFMMPTMVPKLFSSKKSKKRKR